MFSFFLNYGLKIIPEKRKIFGVQIYDIEEAKSSPFYFRRILCKIIFGMINARLKNIK
jgi:hypothetical protein